MSGRERYNPLDTHHLGESVADALLRSTAEPLGEVKTFNGAGIYAIYYSGDFSEYAPIAAQNRCNRLKTPIYVGKAVPPGTRKGDNGLSGNPGAAVFSRLREHAKSLDQVTNLALGDFHCRLLVVDDIWIPLGESMLISSFAPLWNKLIDGFGNHDPGKGRYGQERSRWDTVHPGRPWAMRCRERPESADQVLGELEAYSRDWFG